MDLIERFHGIKGLRQINKGDEQWYSLFPVFFLQLAQCEDRISRWSTGPKFRLCLWQDAIGQPLQAFQKDPSEDVTLQRKERYCPVNITVTIVSVIFVQGDDFGVLHFVWYFALSPALQQQFMQPREKNIFIFLKNFSRNTILSRRFLI